LHAGVEATADDDAQFAQHEAPTQLATITLMMSRQAWARVASPVRATTLAGVKKMPTTMHVAEERPRTRGGWFTVGEDTGGAWRFLRGGWREPPHEPAGRVFESLA